MLTLTQNARVRLTEKLIDYPPNVAARIIRKEGRMKLRPGSKLPGDAVFEHNGRTVLLLDEEMSLRLGARTLDVQNSADGPRLRFRRAKSHGA